MERFNPLIALLGPTTSGKSKLAIEIAQKVGGEILNIDSLTLYKHLNIGTAKPSVEEKKAVRHHLLDIRELGENVTVVDFVRMADETIKQVAETGRRPILVAGSPLYFYSLISVSFQPPPTDMAVRKNLLKRANSEGLTALYSELKERDHIYAAKISPQDRKRIIRALEVIQLTGEPFSSFGRSVLQGEERYHLLKIGLNPERNHLKERIRLRTAGMVEAGLVEEVKNLLISGVSPDSACFGSIGYREALAYIRTEITLEEMVDLINKRTFSYAKHQMTWFKRDRNIHWFDFKNKEEFNKIKQEILEICC